LVYPTNTETQGEIVMTTLFLSTELRPVAVARLAEDTYLPEDVRVAYAEELAGGDPVPSSRPQTDAKTAVETFTIAEAASLLKVAQSTIRRRIKKGDYTVTVAEDGVQRVTLPV
jgi:hypothetical protein